MASIAITGLDEAIAKLTDLSGGRINAAIAQTLNDVANIAKNNTYKEMRRTFDRPTPFTTNALLTEKATPRKLEAVMRLKDPARFDDPHHYLNTETAGGKRGFKPFEARLWRKGVLPSGNFAVPTIGGADFDAYGNMKRGQITQILAYFEAFGDAGFRANMNDEGRARLGKTTKKKRGISYFAIKPGNKGLKPGVYKRADTAFGKAISRVLLFSPVADYKPRIDLQRILNDTYASDAVSLFERNIEAAINFTGPSRF